jgi:tetratricopeptide (TPR) repeat protein
MGGSDERLVGWGCEDSTIGARAIALGNFIVPVYSAASGHVSHPRRTPGEHGEFASNVATAARILDEPFETRDAPLDAYRARATEVIELKPSGRGRKSDARRGVSPPRSAEDHSETGLCHYQVGNFQLASECYAEAARIRADVTWYHLGRAKSLRELGHVDESFAAFDDALRVDGSNCWAHYELGITRARCGDYAGAGQSMRRARELAPTAFDFGWALDTSSTEHKRRGNHHAGQSLHTVAIQDFDLALVADETNCWAHFDRAISMRALDRHHEALAGLARTDALLHPADGNRTWVHAALGRTSMDVGRVNEAKIQLERALELWPANTAAAADLRALHAAGAQRYQLDGSHPVVDAAREIEGWLSDGEGELLAAVTRAATCRVEGPPAAIVEVGSYCGKSTVVIGAALKALRSPVRFYAIDPHQGYDFGRHPDTFEIFTENIRRANVDDRVDVIRARSTDVKSPQPIALLYVDGLHDYASVLADFRHFASDLLPGALVAFHDYFDLCPGVKQCVNELMRNGQCEFVTQRDSLIVCRIPHLENGSVGSHPGDY